MPPRSIKVVEMNTKVEEPVEEVEQAEEEEPEEVATNEADIDSDDLAVLVKEYANERRHKLKESQPRTLCQYCDKAMSAKSLKYSHQKNCKQDPRNQPAPPPPPPPPTPEPEPVVMKTKRRAPVKRTAYKEEMRETVEIHPPTKEDIKEPFTTSYVRLTTVQNMERVELKKKRMKTLVSQAF